MFDVINMNTDAVRSSWDNYDDADTAAAEANADYPHGDGPFMAVPRDTQ